MPADRSRCSGSMSGKILLLCRLVGAARTVGSYNAIKQPRQASFLGRSQEAAYVFPYYQKNSTWYGDFGFRYHSIYLLFITDHIISPCSPLVSVLSVPLYQTVCIRLVVSLMPGDANTPELFAGDLFYEGNLYPPCIYKVLHWIARHIRSPNEDI